MADTRMSPVSQVAGYLRARLASDKVLETPVYVARAPNDAARYISIAQGQSPAPIVGYGGSVAYRITTLLVTCRERDYVALDDLVAYALLALISTPCTDVVAISAATPLRAGDVEAMEITITAETTTKLE